MEEDIFKNKRKSYIEIGEVFFWTATINQWQKKLLGEDNAAKSKTDDKKKKIVCLF